MMSRQVPEAPLVLQPVPMFDDNYLWALGKPEGPVLLVDPGDAETALRALRGRPLCAVLITHHHADHIAGLQTLIARHPAPVYGPDDARIQGITQVVRDGDRFPLAELGVEVDVLSLPGHTRSHIGFHLGPWLFSGDVMFNLGCGRLFEGSPAQMLSSLERIVALPDDTLLCCTHEYTLANARFAQVAEPDYQARDAFIESMRARRAAGLPTLPSRIDEQRRYNPFLRVDDPAVRQSLAARLGYVPDSREARFAALRAWKDEFR